MVGISAEDLSNSRADFLRSIGHILNTAVEFELDGSGQPLIEEEESSSSVSVHQRCAALKLEQNLGLKLRLK